MTIEVETKDCTALTDAEMGEMADLSAAGLGWEAGLLSKQAEEWVLVSQAFEDGRLSAFVFSTLERIGGTPALLLGVGCVGRGARRATVLERLMAGQYHRTLMAFPDEDVIVSARAVQPGTLDALTGLHDIRPWPEVRPNGEERAWGRRLAKRYQAVDFDDRTMLARSDDAPLVFDYESPSPADSPVFSHCDPATGRHLIVWGWALAEHLEGFVSP